MSALEDDEHHDGHRGQDDDAPGERQAVAAEGELARHVAVRGQDGGQAREGVEARVGGQEQDQRGADLEHEEEDAAVAEDGAADLGQDRGALVRRWAGRGTAWPRKSGR